MQHLHLKIWFHKIIYVLYETIKRFQKCFFSPKVGNACWCADPRTCMDYGMFCCRNPFCKLNYFTFYIFSAIKLLKCSALHYYTQYITAKILLTISRWITVIGANDVKKYTPRFKQLYWLYCLTPSFWQDLQTGSYVLIQFIIALGRATKHQPPSVQASLC